MGGNDHARNLRLPNAPLGYGDGIGSQGDQRSDLSNHFGRPDKARTDNSQRGQGGTLVGIVDILNYRMIK